MGANFEARARFPGLFRDFFTTECDGSSCDFYQQKCRGEKHCHSKKIGGKRRCHVLISLLENFLSHWNAPSPDMNEGGRGGPTYLKSEFLALLDFPVLRQTLIITDDTQRKYAE